MITSYSKNVGLQRALFALFGLSFLILVSCKKDLTQNASTPYSSIPMDADTKDTGDDWWCFIFDYGANGTEDWCPKTSIVCDCLKEVVVIGSLKQGSHPLIDHIGDREFLSSYASSPAWAETFASVDVEENPLLAVVKNKIVEGAYSSAADLEDTDGVHHLHFVESNGKSFTLRLRLE